MAIPRQMRFRDRTAVRRVQSRGYRMTSELGHVSIARKENATGRILFVVSNRVSKKSTRRHFIQRRLNEWARVNRSKIKDWDIIVSVRPDLSRASSKELIDRASSLASLIARGMRS